MKAVGIRIKEDDWKEIVQRAERAGKPPTTLARDLIEAQLNHLKAEAENAVSEPGWTEGVNEPGAISVHERGEFSGKKKGFFRRLFGG